MLVPDGVGIKNYLYSQVFKDTSISLSLFHNFDDDTRSYIDRNIDIEEYVEIPNYKESLQEKFLREVIHYARLQLNAKRVKNPSIKKFWKRGHKGLKLQLFYAAVVLRAKLIWSYKRIVQLEKKYDNALRSNPFYDQCEEIVKQHAPSVVFCTHQRSLKAPTVFMVARDLNIPTTTVIYSWDNIPKARLALKSDKYLVWSSYMKNELTSFYPEIPSEAIKITGTPQFEFYKNGTNIIGKETFYNYHKLDPNKNIICFSGDDVKTSPYDPYYLNDIAEVITNSGLDSKCQIVFRRCPVDISGRYDWVLEKFPKLIIDIPPLWNFNSELWSAVYPTFDDIKLLVSLAYYADAVVNVGSTMAFDFGMFNKPCIFINYDHINDPSWSVDTLYKYQHFRSMPNEDCVLWLNSKSEVEHVIQQVLNGSNTGINAWFNVVVEDAEMASEKIIKELT